MDPYASGRGSVVYGSVPPCTRRVAGASCTVVYASCTRRVVYCRVRVASCAGVSCIVVSCTVVYASRRVRGCRVRGRKMAIASCAGVSCTWAENGDSVVCVGVSCTWAENGDSVVYLDRRAYYSPFTSCFILFPTAGHSCVIGSIISYRMISTLCSLIASTTIICSGSIETTPNQPDHHYQGGEEADRVVYVGGKWRAETVQEEPFASKDSRKRVENFSPAADEARQRGSRGR